jgi:hypothetical protein
MENVGDFGAVIYQPAGFGIFTFAMYPGQPVVRGQHRQLDTPHIQERRAPDEKSIWPIVLHILKRYLDLTAGICFENLDLQAHGTTGSFRGCDRGFSSPRLSWIDQYSNTISSGQQLT